MQRMIWTSGATAPGMNAAVRGRLRAALARGWEVDAAQRLNRLLANTMEPLQARCRRIIQPAAPCSPRAQSGIRRSRANKALSKLRRRGIRLWS